MATVTVQEAGKDLAELVQRAIAGEEILIRQQNGVVRLEPVTTLPSTADEISPREALDRLQARSPLTMEQARSWMNDVRQEREASSERLERR